MAEDDISARSAEERRGFFRVRDEILLACRVAENESLGQVKARLRGDTFSVFALTSEFFDLRQEMRALQRASQSESPTFTRYVEAVDRKVDRIVQYLLGREMGTTAHRQWVDLGAEGMAFRMPTRVPTGALLEIELGLLNSCTGLRTCASVLRCQPESGAYRIAVEFHHLRDSDRELLVQHTLRMQARELRQRQVGEGAPSGDGDAPWGDTE